MLKLYFLLYYEFLKIGFFAIGGGYAAVPFLFYMQKQYEWFSLDQLTNMIAVSAITPGPIGINMATYTGYTTAGILGSILATSAIITIPFIFVIAITKILNKYREYKIVNDVFIGLRAAACALLAFIAIELIYKTFNIPNITNLDIKGLALLFILFIPFSFFEKKPLLVIIAGAIGGIIIHLF